MAYVSGTGCLYHSGRWMIVDGPALVLLPPSVPFAFEAAEIGSGALDWYCLFNASDLADFDPVERHMVDSLFDEASGSFIHSLGARALEVVKETADKIGAEMGEGDRRHELNMLQFYLHLLLRAIGQAWPVSAADGNAAQVLVKRFYFLLDRQFPVALPAKRLQLHRAADYANSLAVHVNHLNRVVKTLTGSTTSDIR